MTGAGGGYRSAFGMPQDNQDIAAEVLDCIFHTAFTDRVGNVSGRADDKESTKALVEDQLRGNAAIRASQHNRVGMLALRQRGAQRLKRMRHGGSRGEAL